MAYSICSRLGPRRCEFLRPVGINYSRLVRRSAQDQKEIRLRWPEVFCKRVLVRLLAIADCADDRVEESKG